mmetsp:Transcript_14458/g.24684  ORF Transcript_14458/g.24684 Transcript_14458/m.24684 type:complete len:200 (+) Transcript_14458:3-602(+)
MLSNEEVFGLLLPKCYSHQRILVKNTAEQVMSGFVYTVLITGALIALLILFATGQLAIFLNDVTIEPFYLTITIPGFWFPFKTDICFEFRDDDFGQGVLCEESFVYEIMIDPQNRAAVVTTSEETSYANGFTIVTTGECTTPYQEDTTCTTTECKTPDGINPVTECTSTFNVTASDGTVITENTPVPTEDSTGTSASSA